MQESQQHGYPESAELQGQGQPEAPSEELEISESQKIGRWTDQEHAMFVAYLQFNRDIFRNKFKRRNQKFYKQMSEFIKTRNPLQCRSHHQKLTLKYHYVNRIINNYKTHYDLDLYRHYLQELREERGEKVQNNLKRQQQKKKTHEIDIQTDLMGTNIRYMTMQEYQQSMGMMYILPSTPMQSYINPMSQLQYVYLQLLRNQQPTTPQTSIGKPSQSSLYLIKEEEH